MEVKLETDASARNIEALHKQSEFPPREKIMLKKTNITGLSQEL